MKSKFTVQDMVYIALSAALIAVCSWISIPATVPFTLQTFAVFSVIAILGGRRGTWAVLVFILMAAVGLPVLAGFKGGLGALLGTTGGYVVGFLFIGLIAQAAEKLFGDRRSVRVFALLLGLIVCYAFGTAWFMIVYANKTGPIGLGMALGWCVTPYIPFDLGKLVLAELVATPIRRILPKRI